MKEIITTNGYVALVDDDVHEHVCKFTWYATKDRRTHYALTHIRKGKKYIGVRLHQFLVGAPLDRTIQIDHINGNGLDNRLENLRFVNIRQNQQNRHNKKTSRYPGVSLDIKSMKWRARIYIGGKHKNIGSFESEKSAFEAYCSTVAKIPGAAPVLFKAATNNTKQSDIQRWLRRQ